MTVRTKDKASYVHFGVGGAGNSINTSTSEKRRTSWTSDSQSPTPTEAAKSNAVARRYSTGIGGSGNISFARRAQKDGDVQDDDMAKLLYDRSATGIVLVEGRHHTGIGGFANRYHPTDVEDNEARLNNETMRRQSLAGLATRKASMAGFVPSRGEESRRGSIASMRDLVRSIGGKRSRA